MSQTLRTFYQSGGETKTVSTAVDPNDTLQQAIQKHKDDIAEAMRECPED